MVKAAYSCGKPALGVGAGNVPGLHRAHREAAARGQRRRGLEVVRQRDGLRLRAGGHPRRADLRGGHGRIRQAARLPLQPEREGRPRAADVRCRRPTAPPAPAPSSTPAIVGQSPVWIAEHAGFTVPDGNLDHPGRGVLGRPARAADPGEALPGAGRAAGRIAPTPASPWPSRWWSWTASATAPPSTPRTRTLAIEFGRRVKAVRIIRDSPSTMGGIGDVYNAFVPSMTLGCGSYGHNSVSGNVSAINLINIKRVGRRNNNLQWFKVPSKTYFEPNAIRYLISMLDVSRVTIVTDSTMTRLGFVDKIHRRAGPPAAAGRAADHRFRRAGAVHHHRAPRRRTDAGVQAGHHHRARRRVADGRRQGDVAAVRAPRGGFLRPEGEVLRHPQARLPLPEARRARAAGVHPDHLGHRRRGHAVRRHHRSGDRQEVPAGRLRADPDGGDHRPGADREDAGLAGRRLRVRRADPRDGGVRLGLRQRLHRRHGAAGDPADLRQPRRPR